MQTTKLIMDWAAIIKKEYEILEIRNEKENVRIRNENLQSISVINQSTKSCYAKWNTESDSCLQINGGNSTKAPLNEKDREVRNIFMLPAQTPSPTMTNWLPIPRNFATQDVEDVESASHLSNDTCDGNDSGTKCRPIDDAMFVNLVRRMVPYQNGRNSISSTQVIEGHPSVELNAEEEIPQDVIFQSISSYFVGNYSADKFVKLTKCNTSLRAPNLDEPMTTPIEPHQSLRAYRKYFCRRCCIYNCQLHPRAKCSDADTVFFRKNRVEELKPFTEPCSSTCYLTEKMKNNAPPLQHATGEGTIAENVTDFRDDFIPDSTVDFERSFADVFPSDVSHDLHKMPVDTFNRIFEEYLPLESQNSPVQSPGTETVATDSDTASDPKSEWSSSDQSLFLVLLNVFPYNCCAIAATMRKPCEQVYKKFESMDPPALNEFDKKSRPKKRSKFAGKLQKHLGQTYSPCDHQGPCNETTKCLCLNCEKYCCCDLECRKRMPKCACKGSCSTLKCFCYCDQRECDPEMCGCQNCKNMEIQIGNVKKLQVAPSSIHGWGVMVAEPCQKGDFISEYKGEIISQKECERREKLNDKNDCTYMFSLNGDSVIDSKFFGNKLRFLNFSVKPNCYCRVMIVNGDHRIGVYAAKNITAGEELSIDYGAYDPTVNKCIAD